MAKPVDMAEKPNSGEAREMLRSETAFEKGEVIYLQGSDPDGVYLIMEGEIDISLGEKDGNVKIARLVTGDLLGEISAIENKPHSVTAQAASVCRTLFIPRDAFMRSFSDPLVRKVVHTLAARLRISVASGVARPEEDRADIPLPKTVYMPKLDPKNPLQLVPASPPMQALLEAPVRIDSLPFRVCRQTGKAKAAKAMGDRLLLPAKGTVELANEHFEILVRDERLSVRDLGSAHGTIVNGEKLSRFSSSSIARLRPGRNELVAGGPDSPIRFTLIVQGL